MQQGSQGAHRLPPACLQDVDSSCTILLDGQELQKGQRTRVKPGAVLALGSEEPQRFYPEMGTLYLERIGEVAAAALNRTLS